VNNRKAKKATRQRPARKPERPVPPAAGEPVPDVSADELAAHLKQIELLRTALDERESAVARLLRGFTDVLDSFDRLLAYGPDVDVDAYQASMRRTHGVLVNVLRRNKVELLGEPGEIAEPETHQVLHPEHAADLPEDTVLTVVQRGIRYRDSVVRPATVIVSTTTPTSDDAPSDEPASDPTTPSDAPTSDGAASPSDEAADGTTQEPVATRSGGTSSSDQEQQ
jgi:hypothetical protein